MQEYIDDIRALDAEPLGISVAADFQAKHLMANEVDYDLLLDPDRNYKTAALAVPKIKLSTYLTPLSTKRYLAGRSFKVRQGVPTATLSEPPAVAIVDSGGMLRYLYRGETLGDYPPIGDVMTALKSTAGDG